MKDEMINIKINSIAELDEDFYLATYSLFKNEDELGRVSVEVSLDEISEYAQTQPFILNDSNINDAFKNYLDLHYSELVTLPYISEASPLLRDIFNRVIGDQEEPTMCFITEDEFFEEYTEVDLRNLQEEVQKYNLEDVICFEYDDLITAFKGLSSRFIDDSYVLEKDSSKDEMVL